MKIVVALLAILWSLANLLVAYLFVTSGFLEKTVKKGLPVQGALVMGGVLVGLFALVLLVQAALLVVKRPAPEDGAVSPAAATAG